MPIETAILHVVQFACADPGTLIIRDKQILVRTECLNAVWFSEAAGKGFGLSVIGANA